jgi:hypothetical protein
MADLEVKSDDSPSGSPHYSLSSRRYGNRIATGSEDDIERLVNKLQSGPNSSICTPLTGRYGLRDCFPDMWRNSPRTLAGGFGTVLENDEGEVAVEAIPLGLPAGSESYWDHINTSSSPNLTTADSELPPHLNDSWDGGPAEATLGDLTPPTLEVLTQVGPDDDLPTISTRVDALDSGDSEGRIGTLKDNDAVISSSTPSQATSPHDYLAKEVDKTPPDPSHPVTTSTIIHVPCCALQRPADESTLPPLPPSPIPDSPAPTPINDELHAPESSTLVAEGGLSTAHTGGTEVVDGGACTLNK